MIIRENNETFGADPRSLTLDSLRRIGHEKRPIMKVIRAHCIACCGGEPGEVRKCTSLDCDLWPYRMGKNPFSGRKGNAENLT